MAERLQGRKALITGGDSGIGRAVAVAFAKEGADVAIVYNSDDDGAEQTRQLVEAEGKSCLLIKGDVGDESDVKRIYREAVPALGGLDVLVNNAGREKRGKWEEFTLDDWDAILRTNLTGYFLMVREALRGDYLKEGARIINTGSIEGLDGSAADPAYSVSKGGVHTLTKSLAQYLSDRSILVNCVAPGPVDTPMLHAANPQRVEEGGGEKYPLGIAQPEQIAPSYVFFASDESSYITGEVLAATGGKIISL